MRDPKAIRKAIMTAKSIAAMVDPHFASVPLPDIGQPAPDMLMPEPEPQQFAAGGAPKVGPIYHKTNAPIEKLSDFNMSQSSPNGVLGPALYASLDKTKLWSPSHLSSGKILSGHVTGKVIDLTRPSSKEELLPLSNMLGREVDHVPLMTLEKKYGSVAEGLRNAGYSAAIHQGPGATGRHIAVFDPSYIVDANGEAQSAADRYAAGGGVDDHVVNNPMSVFPKPQRMWDEDMPGGAYLSMPDKQDVTGHKAAQASIGIGEGGKPYFHASRDEVDETGTPGKGSALVKTNLFKQKAGWRWLDAPKGHEGTGTIVSVEHRGNHHYVLDAHFPNGVELSRYPDAPSEPRLRPTTRGSVELGPQVGSILVRGREHPVHSHAIVREYGGRVGYADGGMPDDDGTPDYTAPDNLGLYSHAAATAASLPQAKASPAEFRGMLANKGVKPAEFEESGYDKAFANQPQVTRQQVAAHFHENRTPIVEKSFRVEPPKEEEDAFNATYAQPYYAARDRLSQAIQEGRETGVNQYVDPTEEFRELQRDYEEKGEAFRKNRGLLSNKYKRPYHEDYMLPGGENYREVLLKHGGDDILFGGVNAHFEGEPNILTHLLMKDRTDTEGKKVLHLDEKQSDWAQQGRKQGFNRDPDASKKLISDFNDYSNSLLDRALGSVSERAREKGLSQEDTSFLLEAVRMERRPELLAYHAGGEGEAARYNQMREAAENARKGISTAPYVTNTNDWVDLGLKRALWEAAKGGYDKLAWSPGKTVSDRYNLSKHIEAIHHEKNEDGTYNLQAIDHNGYRAYVENDVPEKKLEETFGKEIASKVASGEGANRKELKEKFDAAKKEFTEFKDKVLEANLNQMLAGRREFDPNYNWTKEHRQEIKDILKQGMERDSYTTAHNLGFGDEHEALRNNLMDAHLAYDKVPNAPGRDWRSLSGLDLQVGGEGMRKFYNDIIPKRLMVLGKKHDPKPNFSTSTVEHPVSHTDYDKGDTHTDLHALDITPRMRESILKNGFVARASGGEVDAPDDEAPIPPRPNPMARSFAAENAPSVTVSPRPGKMGGYPVRAGTMGDAEPWTYATPQGEDQPMPPPVQHPVFNEPRMSNIHEATRKIFKSKGFNDLTEELTGLRNFNVKPIIGTWKGEIEPSFHISHPDMTPDAAEKLSHLLGFGFMQDAAVKGMHNPNPESEGIPSVYMGHNRKLSRADLDRIHEASRQEGLDFSQTSDGRGVKFMHFGDEGDAFDKFAESAKRIQQKTRLPHIHHVNTSGDLNYAQDYLKSIFGQNEGEAGESGDLSSAPRPSDLFGRVINHIVAPYAKAVAAEGYRLSPDRLRDTYGLSDQEHEQVRKALLPGSKDRTVIPLMEGTESLDIRPTGDRGKATVGDALFALQNRAAAHGQIEPGDFSKEAMEKIAKDIAKEVDYHVNTADKSAIGWYDAALKKAMTAYEGVFPELKNDDEKRMLFHAILGITSQGNDVHSNSVHTARLYNLLRNGDMSMPEGVEKLKGTFGDKTRAIEQNLLKFHHLIDANGHDDMRDLFGQKKTVSEWNKILRDRPELHGPDGNPLSMQGGANQKVTGWTVFGPKIGSFINNLSGDYSTLTADLWFSRTWNRLLGHNFIHTPLTEAKQYQDFRDALVAEHAHHNPDQALDEAAAGKTSNGQVTMRNGVPAPWEHGKDVAGMGRDEVDSLINDPDKMLETAKTLAEKYRKGGYKDKSDLRRRAKNWIENRELPVAAPRGNSERDFQQNTVERSQRILKNQYGKDISVADIQAALWFLEKDLFGKMGVASEKAAPADYADAAHNTINLINNGALYNVKSRPNQVEPIAKAYGGVVRKALAVASMPQSSKIRSALMIAKGLKNS